jgi:AraC-like DNA-binding protein
MNVDTFVIWKTSLNSYDTVLILLYTLVFILLSVSQIKNVRHVLASGRAYSYIAWLQVLLLGFILIWFVNLNTFAIIMIVRKPVWCAYTGSIFSLTVFLFTVSIIYLILLKPEIYYVIEKYKSSAIDETEKKNYLEQLNRYTASRKPYLHPDISLEAVANDLSFNPRILSQVINESFGMNFKSYMNEYRIRESMRLLTEFDGEEKNVLEVLYEAGFNSKSVFNYRFK